MTHHVRDFVCPRCGLTVEDLAGTRLSHYCDANGGIETRLIPARPNPTRKDQTR